MSKVHTIHVPYIAPWSKETETPKWFEEKVKEFKGLDVKFSDYRLEEIIGSKLVRCTETWCPCKGKDFLQMGYHATYTYKPKRSKEKGE